MEAELSSSKIGATFAKPHQPRTGETGETTLPCSHARLDKNASAYVTKHPAEQVEMRPLRLRLGLCHRKEEAIIVWAISSRNDRSTRL